MHWKSAVPGRALAAKVVVRGGAILGAVVLLATCHGADEPEAELAVGAQALGALTNQFGRLTTAGDSARRETYNYDALGRKVERQIAMEGIAYLYTSRYGYPRRELGPSDTELGTVTRSTTLPGGEIVRYEYDAGGDRQKVTAGADVIVERIVRNPQGQPTLVVHGNHVESERRYNAQGDLRLRQIVSTLRPPGGAPRILQAYAYTFDGVGNVREIRDFCNPETTACPCDPGTASCTPRRLSRAFDYDEMDRLTQVRAPDGMTIDGLPRAYAYDAIDNLIAKEGVLQSYGAQSKPHALAAAGGVTHSYDPNGNLVSTSSGVTVAWNHENQPVLTSVNGQRVRKQFFDEAVWQKQEAGVTTLYLPSIRIENGNRRTFYDTHAERDPDAGGALRFYHGDHLGSSTLVTDAAGAIVFRAAYLPFGGNDPSFTPSNTFQPKYRFNFKELEVATGFYDYGARTYNPATGRWISPDMSDADGLNRYAYVRNNPVTFTDPDGHDGFECAKVGTGCNRPSGESMASWTKRKVLDALEWWGGTLDPTATTRDDKMAAAYMELGYIFLEISEGIGGSSPRMRGPRARAPARAPAPAAAPAPVPAPRTSARMEAPRNIAPMKTPRSPRQPRPSVTVHPPEWEMTKGRRNREILSISTKVETSNGDVIMTSAAYVERKGVAGMYVTGVFPEGYEKGTEGMKNLLGTGNMKKVVREQAEVIFNELGVDAIRVFFQRDPGSTANPRPGDLMITRKK